MQPENALAHAVLGRAEMQQNEYAKALPDLQAAARLAPSNPQIHLYLEQVYARLGRTTEAQHEKAEFLRLHARRDAAGLPDLEAASVKP
jgi:cytochrome c-type biogenesis protein CcmH/NrfG